MRSHDISSRRRTERITVELPIAFAIVDTSFKALDKGRTYSGVTLDVSKTGMSFIAENLDDERLPELMDHLAFMEIKATLPDNKEVTFNARLAWADKFSNDGEGKYFVGVELLDPGTDADLIVDAVKGL